MADGSVIIGTELDNSGIERDLRDLRRAVNQTADSVEDFADEFDNVRQESSQATRRIESDMDDVKSAMSGVKNSLLAAFSIGAISNFATDLIENTNELRGDLSLLEQNAISAGVAIDTASEAFQRLNTVSGEADSSVEAVSNLLAAGVPDNRMQEAVEGLSNAVIMFPDTLKIESLADSLQETLATREAAGQFGELLDRLGIGAERFSKQLQGPLTEAGRLDLVLQVLNSGSLQGLYDGWAKTNPELVAGRDASMNLQMALADLAEQIQPIITGFTEIAAAAAGWVTQNVDLENLFDIIVAGASAILAVKAIDTIKSLYTAFTTMGSAAAFAQAQSMALYAGLGLVAYAGIQLAQAWGSMTTLEQVVGLLGLLTAAAFTAAIAVGAFQSALTLGIAAAAIVAGITAVMVAVNSAKKRMAGFEYISSLPSLADQQSGIPQLATGAVIPPNRRFMAVLGDQKNGTNLEAPEGLIRQIVREESGGMSGTLRVSPAPGLTRYLKYELEVENERAGTSVVEGVRR